jgi:chromosome segregation ATPase
MPDTPNNDKPTIDERLERLVEHHEALSESVEMLLSAQHANERAIASIGEKVDALTGKVDALTTDVTALTTNVATMHDSISMLGRIAGLHPEKLDQHDGEIESLTAIIERIEKRRQQ